MSYVNRIDNSSKLAFELSTASILAQTLNTPVSLSVFLLIKYKEYDQLVRKAVSAIHYNDVSSFADDYLICSVLKKSQNLPLNVDKREVAVLSFLDSEVQCGVMNEKFKLGTLKSVTGPISCLVSDALGPLNKRRLSQIESSFGFGPGASTGVSGFNSVKSDKYDAQMHLTTELYPFYKSILGAGSLWDHQPKPEIVAGNKFTTVPKNAKTDRGICIEPTLNMYVQKGIGKVLKSILKQQWGVDTTDQGRNQELSRLAYSRGLATIDLSAASDSISFELVKALLPWDWFVLLCTPRCDHTLLDDNLVLNEKFSSMGNGYTFELETLIFAAVVRSVVPEDRYDDTAIYGDDMICPQEYATEVITTLNLLGFKVNREKSFLAGSFFESCGTDWFYGQPVRPFYFRQGLDQDIPYPLQVANALRIYLKQRSHGSFNDCKFKPLWKMLVKKVPKQWRLKIPELLGDSGIIVSFSEATPRRLSSYDGKRHWEGWVVPNVRLKSKTMRKHTFGRLCEGLARLGISVNPIGRVSVTDSISTSGMEPVRGLFGAPAKTNTTIVTWCSGFSWR